MNVPKVSLAIPLHNCESHIGDTIASVLAQSLDDFELTVLDEQSSDRSAEIVHAFEDPRVRYIQNPERLGFFKNWNRCLDVMTGTYCKLLPHDDTLEPTCLEKQARILDEYPDVELVHCARKVIDRAGNILTIRQHKEPDGLKPSNASLRYIVRSGTNPIGEPAAVMFRNSTKKRIAGFSDEDMYSIDVEYWTRLIAEGKRYYIDEVLSSFRIWPDSVSVQLFGSQSRSMHAFFRRMGQKHPDAISSTDVCIGSVKSVLLELARGGYYKWMKLKNR